MLAAKLTRAHGLYELACSLVSSPLPSAGIRCSPCAKMPKSAQKEGPAHQGLAYLVRSRRTACGSSFLGTPLGQHRGEELDLKKDLQTLSGSLPALGPRVSWVGLGRRPAPEERVRKLARSKLRVAQVAVCLRHARLPIIYIYICVCVWIYVYYIQYIFIYTPMHIYAHVSLCLIPLHTWIKEERQDVHAAAPRCASRARPETHISKLISSQKFDFASA